MFVLIIHYYMVCLITVSIGYKKIMNSAVHIFRRLPKFHHISDVLMDFHWLPIRQQSLNFNLLGILLEKEEIGRMINDIILIS